MVEKSSSASLFAFAVKDTHELHGMFASAMWIAWDTVGQRAYFSPRFRDVLYREGLPQPGPEYPHPMGTERLHLLRLTPGCRDKRNDQNNKRDMIAFRILSHERPRLKS
jgi:hypothetical protein